MWHVENNFATWPAFTKYFINTMRPRPNVRHYADNTFKCIFSREKVEILINISLKYVPMVLIDNILSLVQIMAWRQPGDKPLSEAMIVRLLKQYTLHLASMS